MKSSTSSSEIEEKNEAWVGNSQPIKRKTLHDELLERLRDLIVEGNLAAGSKVPEKELCEQFGVSRTPLREALKVLGSEGLIVLTPNRGAMVSELTLPDLEEVFPVVAALEGLSGELACQRMTNGEITAIKKLHKKMVHQYNAGNLNAYLELNRRIHEKIVDCARNQTLSALYDSLSGKIRRARFLSEPSDEMWRASLNEHEQMISAIENRDGETLSTLLRKHAINKLESVKEVLILEDS